MPTLVSVPRVRSITLLLAFSFGFLVGLSLFSMRYVTVNSAQVVTKQDLSLSRLPATSADNKETVCNTPLKLTFIILSSPFGTGAPRRAAIRRTWLNLYNGLTGVKIVAKFVIGIRGLAKENLAVMMDESSTYKDMLLFDNFQDIYDNLSLKVLYSFIWAHGDHDFDYLIKVDDDSFVQLDRFVTALKNMNCPKLLYWGYFNGRGFPNYAGKWAEKQWTLCPHFLPYAMGGGYVLSWKLIDLITSINDSLAVYKNEDVTVGAWLAPFRVHRVHDIRFNTEGHSHGCNNNYIITHKEKAVTFIQKLKSVSTNRTLCQVEREVKPAYLYNWQVPPPLCCKREYGIPIPK
uniref:Hexosyltransferase n=2 Tax=Amphimedon queenslandica TaxID=400682 RepID=A0A1X7VKE1_AMPQE